MKLVKIILVAVGVLGLLGVGLVIAQGPQPEIIVPAEIITRVGPLNISNTMITAWTVMAFLIIGSWLATRSMKLIPTGWQNFVEAGISFVVGQVEEIAGEKNGRRFFPVVATLFLFILISNWFGLLPFFNAIGKTEDVGNHIFHEIADHAEKHEVFAEDEDFAAWRMDDAGSLTLVKPRAKDTEFEIHAGTSAEDALDRYIVFLAEEFTDFELPDHGEGHGMSAEDVVAAKAALDATPDAPKLIVATDAAHGEGDEGGHAVMSPALGIGVTGVSFDDSQILALVVPFFRGVYSDINNTLALALIAFVIIEFWGFQSLGLGYLKKFFDFRGVIPFFVGLLELLSEFIRIISFAFRLFGNIFAGEVLILILTFLMPFLFVDVIYALELFVGFIQASVFALLVLVFGSMATEHHGGEEHHDDHHEEDAAADAHHHPGVAQAH